MGLSRYPEFSSRLATGLGGLKPIWILAPSSLEPLQRGIGFRAVTEWYQSFGPREYGVLSIFVQGLEISHIGKRLV